MATDSTPPTRLLLPGEQEALALLAEAQAEEFKPEEDRRGFTILGWAEGDILRAQSLADHFISLCGDLDAQAAQVEEYAAYLQAQAEAWRKDALTRLSRDRERLVSLLNVYANDTYPQATRTIRRPTGELKRQAGYESLKWGDEAEIIEWLRTHDPDGYDRHVRLVPKLDKVGLKKDLDKGGGAAVHKPTGEYLVLEDVAGDVAVEKKLAWYEEVPDSFTVAPKPKALPAHTKEDDDGNE